MTLTFYTVTNRNYFAGTVAALSSIRAFHPEAAILVFAESRSPLAPEQVAHLRSIPRLTYFPAEEAAFGAIREAWQLKAHGARQIAETFEGVLIHVDSDAVLCASLEEVAAQAWRAGVAAGGKDGTGPVYEAAHYHPYPPLCGRSGDGSGANPHYISSSILFLPLPQMKEVVRLWSIAVDEACFGPQPRERQKYAGHGDQGVLNALLFFQGLTPLVLDNESLSEHWVHGAKPVRFSEGRFWKDSVPQLAFHSVGHAPKFWTRGYGKLARENGNLSEVYLYWLYLLFDGPCGFLRNYSIDAWRQKAGALVAEECRPLLENYLALRQPDLKRHLSAFGRMQLPRGPLPQFAKASPNLFCTFALDGYLDGRRDVHYLYSAIKRGQNYRLLGGEADIVLFVNATCLENFLTPTLLEIARENRITLVETSAKELRALFWREGLDIEQIRLECTAGLEAGQRVGKFGGGVHERSNFLFALEVYLGRMLLFQQWLQDRGYARGAMVAADGGRYHFEPTEIPEGCHVDDLWRFEEFTDLVYQETATGKTELHQIRSPGLREIFDLRKEGEVTPMFQTDGHWLQGTAAAVRRYVELSMAEAKRIHALGYYPDVELVATSIILHAKLWPDFGSMAGHSLRRQLEVTHGIGEPWYRPFYAKTGEEKYTRHFLAPPRLEGRYAVCLTACDGAAEQESRKYSRAAAERVHAYRDILQGRMDVHLFTDNPELRDLPGTMVHVVSSDELLTQWDKRATSSHLVDLQHEARRDPRRLKDGIFLKNPHYAPGMLAKLMAVEWVLALGYDGVLSADADGAQFSRDTIGALGRLHIDAIWRALEFHPFISYIVGTAAQDSFNVWLSTLRDISGVPGGNDGPLDWIWGPCWMMEAVFARRFLARARDIFRTFLDRRLLFYDEHVLNCTYNLPEFAGRPLGGMRDLGDPALVGYRALNPRCFLPYKRWSDGQPHTGRKFRPTLWYDRPDFEYAT